jgi:protein-disulfide isomerase
MSSSFASQSKNHPVSARVFRSALLAVLLAAAGCGPAHSGAPPQPAQPAPVQDTSALKPPAGARVAIVEFDDLECPACAHANPILKAAAAKYNIPWIRHDFLIPSHIWSRNAAIRARWFDTQSKALGDEYRDEVFANQTYIYNLAMLSQFTEKFAQSHGIAMPFAIDPQGKLEAEVQADNDLGKRTGITMTPSIFIVTANSKGAPFIRVNNVDQDLYQDIDQAMADTHGK